MKTSGSAYPSSVKLHDRESRRRKAAKIIGILGDFVGAEQLRSMRCLDVGCYAGLITEHLSAHFQSALGLEPDWEAVSAARQRRTEHALTYLVGDGARLPFMSGSLDILICAQVYEHVTDQAGLFNELWRVLRPGGVCFFSGPNRLALIEEHYGLPGLAWLPRKLADLYVRLAGRGRAYYESPLTYWQLRRRLRRFSIHDYTAEIIRSPERFACSQEIGRWTQAWLRRLPRPLLNALAFLAPNYNWVLVKPGKPAGAHAPGTRS